MHRREPSEPKADLGPSAADTAGRLRAVAVPSARTSGRHSGKGTGPLSRLADAHGPGTGVPARAAGAARCREDAFTGERSDEGAGQEAPVVQRASGKPPFTTSGTDASRRPSPRGGGSGRLSCHAGRNACRRYAGQRCTRPARGGSRCRAFAEPQGRRRARLLQSDTDCFPSATSASPSPSRTPHPRKRAVVQPSASATGKKAAPTTPAASPGGRTVTLANHLNETIWPAIAADPTTRSRPLDGFSRRERL